MYIIRDVTGIESDLSVIAEIRYNWMTFVVFFSICLSLNQSLFAVTQPI